jgi:thiamine biosynthesis protein ThiS
MAVVLWLEYSTLPRSKVRSILAAVALRRQIPGIVMRLIVNGIAKSVADGTGLLDLLAEEGIPPKAAIVEVNRKFVARADLDKHALRDGDQVELILPAFGG